MQTPSKWPNTVFETIRWKSLTRWRDDHCALHTPGAAAPPSGTRTASRCEFFDVPVVNDFFRSKVRRHLGWAGALALAIVNPDRLPVEWRTNLYVRATKT